MTRAVVFAYHDIGVRCLEVLLARGIEVPLVVTHEDDPAERRFFASVADHAGWYGIDTIKPGAENLGDLRSRLSALAPDFLFSFYYRYLLPPSLLDVPISGALNMHGSLLPHYRGRAPVNWAVLAGEPQTGVTLHYMTARPDAGDKVAQGVVPILPNDTAGEVMEKLSCAAENLLWRILPDLVAGRAPRMPLDLTQGNYCGRRRPEDGKIDWRQGAWEIHNLIRAVAPPYPGAFCQVAAGRLCILRSHYRGEQARGKRPQLYLEANRIFADCVAGERFEVLKCLLNNQPLTAISWAHLLQGETLALGD